MKAFVINFNRITSLIPLCDFLHRTGCEVIIVDNNSTYTPLLEYYKNCPYKVFHMKRNYRSYGFFYQNVLAEFGVTGEFILTDSDLDVSKVPENYLEVLRKGLELFPDKWKCGLSLEIEGLPNTLLSKQFIEWEKRHWEIKDKGYFLADVATTFALYRNTTLPEDLHSGVRSDRPYTCIHLPTNLSKEDILNSPEEFYYIQTAITNGWSQVANEVYKLGIEMTPSQKICFRDDDIGFEYGGESNETIFEKFVAVDKVFKDNGVVHTIAIIGKDFEKCEKLIQYIKEQNHISFQLHCWEHIDYTKNHDKISEHLQLGKQKIYDIFGVYPTMFFPPWNQTDEFVNESAVNRHLKCSVNHSTLEGYLANGVITNDVINFHFQHDSPQIIEQVIMKLKNEGKL